MTDNNSLLSDARQILEGLKRTGEGTFLYGLIARGLRKFDSTRFEGAFLVFADKLLDRYLSNPESDPGTRVRVKVIQQRLRPYLEDLAGQKRAESPPEPETATTIAPAVVAPTDAADATAPVPETGSAEPVAEASAPEVPVDTAVAEDHPVAEPDAAASAPAAPESPDAAVPDEAAGECESVISAAEASATDATADVPASAEHIVVEAVAPESETLPEQLARQMAAALTRSHDFDDLLRESLDTLERDNAAVDIGALKQVLRRGIEELIDEHQSLRRNLTGARRGLEIMVEDHRQLEQALDNARKHSLTDELTGLPNHAAFLRQLDAEIGRARRYGFSLALALLDIDDMKSMNTRYGRAAGDTVLRTYAHDIMSQFRSYDLVARYGGDEFVILLPNTQREGAARAVEKAQKRAAGTYIQFDGYNIPLPSFSSVLTVYAHGEPPAALLKRADEALSHAKQRGHGQAVIALPTG